MSRSWKPLALCVLSLCTSSATPSTSTLVAQGVACAGQRNGGWAKRTVRYDITAVSGPVRAAAVRAIGAWNTTNAALGNQIRLVENWPNYDSILATVIAHEIGHTMGLDDVAVAPRGVETMGHIFVANDCIKMRTSDPS